MEKGKYPRDGPKGISKLQKEILSCLDDDFNPKTLESIQDTLFSEDKQTWSNKVLLNMSLSRLRKRGLIKSTGRNQRAQNLWIRGNESEKNSN